MSTPPTRMLGENERPLILRGIRNVKIALAVYYLPFLVFIIFSALDIDTSTKGGPATWIFLAAALLIVPGWISSMICTGVLAGRIGLSPIIWGGLPVLLSPIGQAFSGAMIVERAKKALTSGIVAVR